MKISAENFQFQKFANYSAEIGRAIIISKFLLLQLSLVLVGIVKKLENDSVELIIRTTKKKITIKKPDRQRDPIYDRLEENESVFVDEKEQLVTSFNSGHQDYYLRNAFNKEKPS